MDTFDHRPPSFLKRCAAVWVDLILLLGAYLVLGFTFQHIFDANAYPKRTGMQLYSERDLPWQAFDSLRPERQSQPAYGLST
jgi:hypothetical protein